MSFRTSSRAPIAENPTPYAARTKPPAHIGRSDPLAGSRPRWLEYEKADTALGALVVVVGAAAIMIAAAAAFTGTTDFGHYKDGLGIAQGLSAHISRMVGTIFALVLFDASIVGASAVTLATSYAFGDMFGLRHSLHRGIGDAKLFYGSYGAMVALAVLLVAVAPCTYAGVPAALNAAICAR